MIDTNYEFHNPKGDLFIYLVLCHTYTLSYLFGSRIDVFNSLEQSCHLEVGAQPTEEKLDAIR